MRPAAPFFGGRIKKSVISFLFLMVMLSASVLVFPQDARGQGDGVWKISTTCTQINKGEKLDLLVEVEGGKYKPAPPDLVVPRAEGVSRFTHRRVEGGKPLDVFSLDIPREFVSGSRPLIHPKPNPQQKECFAQVDFQKKPLPSQAPPPPPDKEPPAPPQDNKSQLDAPGAALKNDGVPGSGQTASGLDARDVRKTAGQPPATAGGLVLYILLGISISLSIFALLVIVFSRKNFEDDLFDIREQVEEKADAKALAQRAADLQKSIDKAMARIKALEERAQQAEPIIGESLGGPAIAEEGSGSLSFEEFVEGASAALSSAASFDDFTARFNGAGYDRWDAVEGSAPSPRGGAASQALLWVAHYPNNVGYVFPSFGMQKQLTLWTSDNGRYADERLGWMFTIENGPRMRAVQPAEVDLRTGKISKIGILQLPLE
jgi:hypothetical protein